MRGSRERSNILRLLNSEPIGWLQAMERNKQNEILCKVKLIDGVSLRQIASIFIS